MSPPKAVAEAEALASSGAGSRALAAQPPRLRFAALEVPTFRWYWAASWISSTGDGMENVIRNVLVVQLAGAAAPFWLGMMVFAHWVPFTLFSLYGGVLADRYDNRKVQIVAQLLLMTAAVSVAAATLSGIVTTWWIFAAIRPSRRSSTRSSGASACSRPSASTRRRGSCRRWSGRPSPASSWWRSGRVGASSSTPSRSSRCSSCLR